MTADEATVNARTSPKPSLGSLLPLSPAEEARLSTDWPFPEVDATTWAEFALSVGRAALHDYSGGDISLYQLLRTVRSAALKCDPVVRLNLLGYCAEEALRLKRRPRNARRAEHPAWLKRATAMLVVEIKAACPKMPLRSPLNGARSIIRESLRQIAALGLVSTKRALPAEGTVYLWYREYCKAEKIPLQPGRRRKG